MALVISPFIPFPNISWWAFVLQSNALYLDKAEHFEKMSYRNRYYITGSNGLITLSIPLEHGRDQRTAMGDIRISNNDRWQVQHWRTLVSVYRRAPYFEHYEPSLQQLFEQRFEYLVDFNLASVHWLKKQLGAVFEEKLIAEFVKEYSDATHDLRKNFRPGIERQPSPESPYYQLFSERNGFLPDLSVLDLLFTEGPYTLQWIKMNMERIPEWRAK